MQKSFIKSFLLAVVAALTVALSNSALAQGLTTASLSGFVTNKDGQPVSGASVIVVHDPSGTRAITNTRANGQYTLSGLRIGGPYTVTVESPTYSTQTSKDVYVDQGDVAAVSFVLTPELLQLEKFSVTGSRDTTFTSGKMGAGSAFSDREIDNVSSVRRNIQDIAQLDSRLYLGSLDQGGQLSAQGQNFRFNSLLVDGVQAVDTFGLNSNGFSSLRSPIPLEAIQSFSVELAPYDVRRAGFTGALLNAVIKSGTNDYHGILYYEKTDQDWRQKNPVSNARENFKERVYGIGVGGPIIRNKLFFYLHYEDFERQTAAPQANFVPDATQVATIVARAKALGYDPGALTADNNLAKQETKIAKIDYNISDKHRTTFTYRQNYGETTAFPNYTGNTTTSLSSTWFQQPVNTDSYTGQLFSQWTPDFRTEATVSYTKYNGSPANNGSPFPQVSVQGVTGTRLDTGATGVSGTVVLGTDSSRQLNFINTRETQGKFSGEYSIGNHTITSGIEDVQTKYQNAFVQFTSGAYTFANINNWVAGTPPSAYQLQLPFPGYTIDNAIARWRYDAYAGFIEDTWKPNQQLTLLVGLRYDYPYVPEAPPVAAGFATAGFVRDNGQAITRNNTTNSGNATLAPRIGFTYQLKTERKTQIRGGFGLFQGKNPAVWISNAYSNSGATASVNATTAQLPTITFSPDVKNQPIPAGTLPTPNININDPSLRQPALWKSNLALDHQLPFGNMTFTAELGYNKVEEALNTEFLNYKVATDGPSTLPDGRIRYGTAAAVTSGTTALSGSPGRRRISTFADVYYLTNTSKGFSTDATVSVRRSMKNQWAWSAAYTRGHATEVSPFTSSTAGSNYSLRAVYNPNENVASISNTNIRDRVVVQVTREFEFIRKYKTTISAVYQGRTGHPYSWIFRGDANGDGFTFNDLLYVPTGPGDAKVAWASTTERDAFFAFAQASGLAKYAGGHAPRNSETSPWTQQIDLKLVQALPLYGSVRAELYVNILNFWNLFNKHFGSLDEVPFSYKRAVAGATYNPLGNNGLGQWNYTFSNTGTLDAVPTTVNETPVSRWQAQAGIRLRF